MSRIDELSTMFRTWKRLMALSFGGLQPQPSQTRLIPTRPRFFRLRPWFRRLTVIFGVEGLWSCLVFWRGQMFGRGILDSISLGCGGGGSLSHFLLLCQEQPRSAGGHTLRGVRHLPSIMGASGGVFRAFGRPSTCLQAINTARLKVPLAHACRHIRFPRAAVSEGQRVKQP